VNHLGDSVLETIEEIAKKVDELKESLKDVLLTAEEYALIKETDEIVKNKRFNELKALEEV
jgi:uncharacterized protein YacL (UPF0231 family)